VFLVPVRRLRLPRPPILPLRPRPPRAGMAPGPGTSRSSAVRRCRGDWVPSPRHAPPPPHAERHRPGAGGFRGSCL